MYVQDVRAVRRMGQGLSEQVAVHMCGFDGIQRGNYFGGEPIRTEVEVRGQSLRTKRMQVKVEVTRVLA